MTGHGRKPNEPDREGAAEAEDDSAATDAPAQARVAVARAKTQAPGRGPAMPDHVIAASGSPSDTLIPPAWVGDFAEEISDDLIFDAADSLRLIRAPDSAPKTNPGIRLSELGGGVELRQTTQKIVLRPAKEPPPTDEDETVVDLADTLDSEDGITEEIAASLLRQHRARAAEKKDDRAKTEDLPPADDDEDA